MYITLNDSEKAVLSRLISSKIENIKKVPSDPFFTADIVSIYRKLNEGSPEKATTGPIEVVHGGSDDVELPKDKPEENAPTNKPRLPKNKVVVTDLEVLPDNIDGMTDALTEEGNEEVVIEKPTPKSK